MASTETRPGGGTPEPRGVVVGKLGRGEDSHPRIEHQDNWQHVADAAFPVVVRIAVRQLRSVLPPEGEEAERLLVGLPPSLIFRRFETLNADTGGYL